MRDVTSRANVKKRDSGVELVRLLACMIVVGVHTCLSSLKAGAPDAGRLFMACLFADGVALFWMVSGFFMFNNRDYKKLLIHTVKHIVIPMLAVSVLMFYFSGWLIDGESLSESISHPLSDYKDVISTLLMIRNPINHLGHFWYLYIYLLIIIIFPALRAFADYLDESVQHQKIFIIVSFVLLLINDITSNKTFAFSHYSVNGLVPAAIEMLWGHILYRNRKYFTGRKFIAIGASVFIGMNLLRTFIQYNRYLEDTSNTAILYWYSTIGILCSIGVIMFCFNMVNSAKDSKINHAICILSSYTFMIYLIHPIIKNILNRFGFQSWLSRLILHGNSGFVYEAAYNVCILLTVFLLSLAVAVLLRIPAAICNKVARMKA